MVTYGAGLPLNKSQVPLIIWSNDVTWQNKRIYLYFHKTCKYQIWHSCGLGSGAQTENHVTLDHVVTRFLLSKDL